MAEKFTKEYITLPYHPQAAMTETGLRDLVRLIEGHLQRIEGRVEANQDALLALAARVAALE
jgi:hypothetical protein